jgi:hypothetical protein
MSKVVSWQGRGASPANYGEFLYKFEHLEDEKITLLHGCLHCTGAQTMVMGYFPEGQKAGIKRLRKQIRGGGGGGSMETAAHHKRRWVLQRRFN